MAPGSAVVLAAAALSAAMFAGADAQAVVAVQSTNRKMLAERGYALPKSMMAPVPAPAPGPAMANAMGVDLTDSGSSRRLQAAQTKAVVGGRSSAAAPAGAVAVKLPLMADSGAPAAGMDLAEATLPTDTNKPSKQMRMSVGAKAAMPIKRVRARIFGAGPSPAPAPAPSADVEEASGM